MGPNEVILDDLCAEYDGEWVPVHCQEITETEGEDSVTVTGTLGEFSMTAVDFDKRILQLGDRNARILKRDGYLGDNADRR